MDFFDAIMLALQGIIIGGSSAALLALSVYITLALRGNSPTLLSTADSNRLNRMQQIFLGLACIGFLTCMYQGADALLFWMPDAWGGIDEEGEFQTYRSGLAATFAATGGIALICFIDQATRNKTSLFVLRKQIEDERIINAAGSMARLSELTSKYQSNLDELRRKNLRDSLGREPLTVEHLQIDACNELLRLIGTRLATIRAMREAECPPSVHLPPRLVDETIGKELAKLRALARLDEPGLRSLQEWVERKCREDLLPGDRLDIDTLGTHEFARWIEEGLEELIDEASEALIEAVGEALNQKRLEEVRQDIMANLGAECNSRQKLPPVPASPAGPSTPSSPTRGRAPGAMLVETGNVLIHSRDFWVKIVEFLQHNWALIEPAQAEGVTVYFVGDTSGVFDEIAFPSATEAVASLRRNGFRRYADDSKLQSFLRPPPAPFNRRPHPNGRIYSSGRFWRS